MEKKKKPAKKELRVLFTPEHYARLENQAERLDMTSAALVRMWAMEKVGVLEALRAQSGAVDILNTMRELAEEKTDENRT